MKLNNIKLICAQNEFTLSENVLNSYGDVIVGWSHQDEPDNAQWNGSSYDPCVDPTEIQSLYNQWKTNDSTRPVYLNLGQGVSNIDWTGRGTCTGKWEMYDDYILGCDIVAYDIYPVSTNQTNVQGNLWYLPKGVDSLRSWCNDQKPVWDWIECTPVHQNIKPTKEQVTYLVWSSIIHGARGISYFAPKLPGQSGADYDGVLNDPVMLDHITQLNQQILSLAPVLNSNDILNRVEVSSSNSEVPVDILVKEYQGVLYIFAAAMRNSSTTASFTVQNVPTNTVFVLGEDREITISGNNFEDDFSGYGVHLYQIGGTGIIQPGRIAQNQELSVFISPNPFYHRVRITNVKRNLKQIKVFNLQGELVFSQTFNSALQQINWSAKDLLPGVYTVNLITTNNQLGVYSVIKLAQ
ncbi:MAG: hypothetical protein DRP54_08910 [Spirochaetes bacterium]|nr:MAG: hypothetical protein DRP54_08910 [Spirochaetota bacterium]